MRIRSLMIGGIVVSFFLLVTALAFADGVSPAPMGRTGAPGKITDIRIVSLADEEGTVVLSFLNTDGSVAGSTSGSLLPNQPASWNQAYYPAELPNNWKGSVVLYSDVALASIVNEYTNPMVEAASYVGSSEAEPSTSAYLPSILKDAWTWTTMFAVQNTGTVPTTITVEYRDLSGALVDTDISTDVQPGASLYAFQADDAELGSFFAGSAKIMSDPEPIYAIANEDSTYYDTMAYEGFSGGSTSVYLASILKTYYCWSSDIRLMNVGTSSTDATLEFRDLDGNLTYSTTVTLAPQQPWATNQHSDANLPNAWAGSVRITTDPAQPIAAIVNEVAQDTSCGSGKAMAYSGVGGGEQYFSLPSILKYAYGWFTDIRMMNTTGSEVGVTRTYRNMGGAVVWSDTQSIPAYGVRAYNQSLEAPLGGFFEGSVSLEAEGDVAVIVNEVAVTADVSMVYNGIPAPAPSP